jgi:hypothetical protein
MRDADMSRTYSLVCHETQQALWIGQGRYSDAGMTTFYSGMPVVMQRLGRFLEATRGKPLVLLSDDERPDYKEFEEPDREAGDEA